MNYQAAKEEICKYLEDKLPKHLKYHSYRHIMDVLDASIMLGEKEGVGEYELTLLKTAALFHDVGFTIHFSDHEAKGVTIAKVLLPKHGYSNKDLDIIEGLIMATKMPQTPKTPLEEIICDADLDYLGRDDFYEISNSLRDELKEDRDIVFTDLDWNKLQIQFLTDHTYYTTTAKALRDQGKLDRVAEIKEKYGL